MIHWYGSNDEEDVTESCYRRVEHQHRIRDQIVGHSDGLLKKQKFVKNLSKMVYILTISRIIGYYAQRHAHF